VRRFPVVAFAALVVATVAAFFITQHLKVTTPLIAGYPRPYPAAINPIDGVTCYDPGMHRYVSHRAMTISFYLLHASDRVNVYVVDSQGRRIATLASGRYMPGGSHPVRSQFVWDGREQNGSLAPDGRYYVRVHLIHQNRTVTISDNSGALPVTVITVAPHPVITSVTPQLIAYGARSPVTIDYKGNENRLATVLIFSVLPHQRPKLVKSFLTAGQSATWDGLIRQRPAPPGTYLVALQVTDAACNAGYFPPKLAPASAVAHTTLTVRR
jgi:hypothetical protein